MKIVLVGDTVLAREPAARPDSPTLTGDVVIANLEAPLTDVEEPAEKEMTIRLPTSTAALLRALGVDVVSIATNHALDHGPEGLLSTLHALDGVGIRHAGGGRTLTEADAGTVVDTPSGERVAVLSFCSTLPPGAGATATRPGIAPLRIDQSFALDGTLLHEQPGTPPFVHSVAQEADVLRVEERVRTARAAADRVVACLHWGVPFAYLPPNQGPLARYQQDLGRRLVDAGADVVAGTHPHCLHPVERWHDGLILYSLGNFLFHTGEVRQPDTFLGLPYRVARLFEGTPWFDSAVFEVDLPPLGPPQLRITPITLDAAGEPRIADRRAARRIRALVEESAREIDAAVRIDADGLVHFAALGEAATRCHDRGLTSHRTPSNVPSFDTSYSSAIRETMDMTIAEESVRTVTRAAETSISYTVSGPTEGPTWVYVHGWGCRRTDFAAVAAFLPAEHRVIAVDLAGHGDSTAGRADWSMAEFARDVAAVLDAESVGSCVVVGHSLGGAVAIELARLRPDVVTRIVGLDSFHYLGLYPAIEDSAARGLLQVFEDDFPAGVRSLVVMGSVPDTDPEFGETIFAKMSGIAPAVGTGALAEMLRWDMDEALAAVPHPVATLAVRGLLDPAAVERYGDRIDFVVHDLGSHHFPLERPEETAKLLLAARTTG